EGEGGEQAFGVGGVERGGGVVEHKEAGGGRERAGKLEHTLLAIGERGGEHGRARFQSDEAQQTDRLRAAAGVVARECGAVHDVLPARNVVMDMESADDIPQNPTLLE